MTSEFIRHIPCDNCGSSDANSLYSDGHSFCFSCLTHKANKTIIHTTKQRRMNLIDWKPKYLKGRNLEEKTLQKYSYGLGRFHDSGCHVANYFKEGAIVAQHLRLKGKNFKWLGDTSNLPFFGQHLWTASKGQRYLVITEGEIDCLSVAQCRDLRWATVSLPNGVQSAVKAFEDNYDWVASFEEVILFFDQDEPGKQAVKKVVDIVPSGKVRVVRSFPYKDASEALQNNDVKSILDALFQAEYYSPEEIVEAQSSWEDVVTQHEKFSESISYPWKALNDKLHGFRKEEIVVLTGGSKSGKSSVCREIALDLVVNHKKNVGYIALEESHERSLLQFMSLLAETRLSKFLTMPNEDKKLLFDKLTEHNNLFLFKHFGSLDPEVLFNRIRYLVKSKKCEWIFLDHLSIIISGSEGDDRKNTDLVMTKLRSLVQELGCGLFCVSHLRKAFGKPHEKGGEVNATDLRGSHSIFQLSDVLLAIERNQQHEDTTQRSLLIPRVLADRFDGNTGLCRNLLYDTTTGRIRDTDIEQNEGNGIDNFEENTEEIF